MLSIKYNIGVRTGTLKDFQSGRFEVYNLYWNFTTCIRCDRLDAIVEAITHLLEQEEGCCRLTQVPQLAIDIEQLRDLPVWERPRLWVAGLCSGKGGWTIVKTWPVEWLCNRATGASRSRLSALAMQLGCDAFHYRVVRDIDGILLEADATGRIFLSGWNDYEVSNSEELHQFYGERIDLPKDPQFSLIEVPESIQAAMQETLETDIRKEAEYEREYERQMAQEKPDRKLLNAISSELREGYAERIDIALEKVIDGSESCWYLHDLLYNAYAEPQQLEEMGVQLLYFQPPITYNPTFKINLPPDSSSEDEEDDWFWS